MREKILPVMEAEDQAFIRMPEQDRAEFLRLSRIYVDAMIRETSSIRALEERS